jgi:hypothetical protein
MCRTREAESMNRIPIVAASLMGLLLCACDKLQQQGPPPTYQSPTLEVARSISGAAPEAPASAASGAAAK